MILPSWTPRSPTPLPIPSKINPLLPLFGPPSPSWTSSPLARNSRFPLGNTLFPWTFTPSLGHTPTFGTTPSPHPFKWVRLCWFSVVVCCRDPAIVFLPCLWFGRIGFWKGFLVSGGEWWFLRHQQTSHAGQGWKGCGGSNLNRWQKGVGRAYCTESDVWRRKRCRQCYHDIPADTGSKSKRSQQSQETGPLGRQVREGWKVAPKGQDLAFQGARCSEDVCINCVEVEDDSECRRILDVERKTCGESHEKSKHCGSARELRWVKEASVARGGKKAEQLHAPKGLKEVFRTWEALRKIRAEIDGKERRGKGQMPRREGRRKVKMHKSKAESVISWCCQRQTKAHQRVVVCSGGVLFKCCVVQVFRVGPLGWEACQNRPFGEGERREEGEEVRSKSHFYPTFFYTILKATHGPKMQCANGSKKRNLMIVCALLYTTVQLTHRFGTTSNFMEFWLDTGPHFSCVSWPIPVPPTADSTLATPIPEST